MKNGMKNNAWARYSHDVEGDVEHEQQDERRDAIVETHAVAISCTRSHNLTALLIVSYLIGGESGHAGDGGVGLGYSAAVHTQLRKHVPVT